MRNINTHKNITQPPHQKNKNKTLHNKRTKTVTQQTTDKNKKINATQETNRQYGLTSNTDHTTRTNATRTKATQYNTDKRNTDKHNIIRINTTRNTNNTKLKEKTMKTNVKQKEKKRKKSTAAFF